MEEKIADEIEIKLKDIAELQQKNIQRFYKKQKVSD